MLTLLMACLAEKEVIVDTDPPVDTDTDTDTDTDVDSGVIEIQNPTAECGDVTKQLVADSRFQGTRVVHHNHHQGCCPDFSVLAHRDGDQISVSYFLQNDLCDCICPVDLAYNLIGMPPGTYTLHADGDSVTFDQR